MRYLIPEFTGLGDFIQKTPMIQTIKELDIEAEIFLIGDNRWKGLDLVQASPMISGVCDIQKLVNLKFPENYTNSDIEKLYKRLTRSQKAAVETWLFQISWDVFFDNSESDVPGPIMKIIEKNPKGKIIRHVELDQIIHKVGAFGVGRIFRPRVQIVPLLSGRHDIDGNYDLFEAFFQRPFERTKNTWISIPTSDTPLLKWGLQRNKYICIQPGAANGAKTPKTWSPDNFVSLTERLEKFEGLRIVLLGDYGDNENIISKKDWPAHVINTAGCTNINEAVALISGSACVVAHDSGIMHLANALSVPLVALYGPTDYTRTKPFNEKSRVLFSKTELLGAMYQSRKSERQIAEEYPNHYAMSGITVEQVENTLLNLIGDLRK